MDDIQILRVDTGEAVRSIADLKENIKLLKEQLNEAEIGSKAYADTLVALQTNQAALKNAIHDTTYETDEQADKFAATAKAAQGLGTSYNALVRRMADLDQQFRATEDATKRAQLGAEIKNINAQLKELDEARGKYGRNVGNYKSALDGLSGAFRATAGSAGAAINPIANMTTGLKAISATPAVAILGLLANVLSKVIEGLKSSDENTNRMKEALAVFQPIGDAATRTLQALGAGVAWVVEQVGKLAARLGLLKDASQERQRIASDEIRLQQQQRETIRANADAERDVAELRAKAADREKYTAAERLEFLRQAGDQEAEIARRAYEDAKLAYEIQKARNALTQSSAEEKRKEAEAYAAMVKAETDYNNRLKGINQQITRKRREMASEAAAAASARIAAEKDVVEQEIALTRKGSAERLALQEKARRLDYEKSVTDARKNVKDTSTRNRTLELLERAYLADIDKLRRDFAREQAEEDIKVWENRMNGYEQGSELYLAMAVELRQRQYDTLARLDDESDADWEARRIAALQSLRTAEQALLEKGVAEGRLALENEMNALRVGSVEQLRAAVSVAEYDIDNLHQRIGESDEAFRARQIAAHRAQVKAAEALEAAQTDAVTLAFENRMNAYRKGSLEYLDAAVDLKRYELDTLHKTEEESEDEFRARMLAKEEEYNEALRAKNAARVELFTTYVSAISGLVGSLASIYEANGEADEEAAQKAKALRTAEAIISTISGAVSAYMNTIETIKSPAVAIPLAIVNAATVLAAGYAQVKQINAVKVGSGGGGTAVVPAPSFPSAVPAVRNVTGRSEEERLNRMADKKRVVVVWSDIEAKQDEDRVQIDETTW